MERLEEYLKKQLAVQLREIRANEGKGDLMQYAENLEDTTGVMLSEIQHHVNKMVHADRLGATDNQLEHSADIINCVLFYMINRKLITIAPQENKTEELENFVYPSWRKSVEKSSEFKTELASLLNRHCKENGSNTPDYILAEYLTKQLNIFDEITNRRNKR